MKNYNLFLDDERFPVDEKSEIARSFDQAVEIIRSKGVPLSISFDHDLGDNSPTGFDFAKWLISEHLDGRIDISTMSYSVHSQNPVGAMNIKLLFENFYTFLEKENV